MKASTGYVRQPSGAALPGSKPDEIAPVRIVLNGQTRTLEPGATLAALVASLDLGGRRMAVEINEEVIPRSEHADRVLAEGDRVEIVHAVGGG